jgi:hypothetical protein
LRRGRGYVGGAHGSTSRMTKSGNFQPPVSAQALPFFVFGGHASRRSRGYSAVKGTFVKQIYGCKLSAGYRRRHRNAQARPEKRLKRRLGGCRYLASIKRETIWQFGQIASSLVTQLTICFLQTKLIRVRAGDKSADMKNVRNYLEALALAESGEEFMLRFSGGKVVYIQGAR